MEAKFEGEDRRESSVTVKWYWVLGLFAIIFGTLFTAILNHETRITRTEDDVKYAVSTISELKIIAKENNSLSKEANIMLKQHMELDRR